jgi:predicted RND superfamily exporter protein
MFKKSSALTLLGLGFALTFAILIFRPEPSFDYDFELFFPIDDPDLAFYQDFERQFESDNDYLLIALGNPDGPWMDSAFLEKSSQAQQQIMTLNGVDSLVSILDFQIPVIGLFGMNQVRVLDWDSKEKLEASSKRLPQFKSSLISQDGNSFLFLVKNDPSLSKEQGDTLYAEIREVMKENGIVPKAVAGKIQTQGDFVTLMQNEFGMFLGVSFLLMILTLYLIFRSWWGVVIPVLVLALGVLWAIALILFSGKALDIMSVMQPTIFLIVGLSGLVHFFTEFIKKLNSGLDRDSAVEQTFNQLTFAVWLTIFTTSIGFLSLYFTSIPALKTFGLWTGIGVLIIFSALVSITPGLLYLIPVSRKTPRISSEKSTFLAALFLLIIQKRKQIIWIFLGVTVGSLILGSQLKINGYLLDNLPSDHPIQQDFSYFDSQFGGSNPLEISIAAGPKANSLLDYQVLLELNKLEKKLQETFGEREIISPLSLVKALNQAQNQGNRAAFALPSQGQYLRMRRFLKQAVSTAGENLVSPDQKSGRISTRVQDLGSLEMGERRNEVLEYVNQEINPDLLQVRWTGTAYLIDRSHESVTRQMLQGLSVALVVVGLIGGFLFRSWRLALVLLIPNVIPLIWMLGLMFLMGIEFKLTTSILFTVAFGIAVDDTIHFMSKLKTELQTGKSLHYAIKRTFMEAGRAIILTSVILVMGFGLLAFSQFGVTHLTGLLISFTLVFALASDLFLLPVLLFSMKKVWDQKATGRPQIHTHPK